eukprot:6255687-Pyramimonas_sp.AAC.1
MSFGLGGPGRSWIAPLRKLQDRLQYIRGLVLGLAQHIRAYATFGFPRAQVSRAISSRACGPRLAVPLFVLARVSEIGLPVQVRSVALENQAAMYRVCLRSEAFPRACDRWCKLREVELERLTVARRADWVQESIAGPLCSLFTRFQAIPMMISDPDLSLLQKQIYSVLESRGSLSRPSVSIALTPRLRKFRADMQSWHCDRVLQYLRIAGIIAPWVSSAYLRTICNGWCTSARFGQGCQVCRFGCQAMGGYHVLHCLSCPLLLSSLPRLLPSLPEDVCAWSPEDTLLLCHRPSVDGVLFLRAHNKWGLGALSTLLAAMARAVAKKRRAVRAL